MYLKTCLAVVAVLLLAACGGSRTNDPVEPTQAALDRALQEVVDKRIVPAATGFKNRANLFLKASEEFCALQDEQTLQALRAQWKNLAADWYKLLPYNFGPMKNDVVFPNFMYVDSYRLRGTYYAASVRQEIAEIIEQNQALENNYFSRLPFQKSGLLALEILSYESANASTETGEVLQSYAGQSLRCDLLLGHADNVYSRAVTIEHGWLNEYNQTGIAYRQLFLNAQLDDDTPPLTLLLTSVQEFMDYLKLRNVVGNVAQIANYAWPLVQVSALEVQALLTGDESHQFNFLAIMSSSGHQAEADTVRDNMQFLSSSVEQQNSTDFYTAAGLLDGNFKREIPNGLDVDLGITFSDGD